MRKITKTLNIYKEGISELNEIFTAYNYKIILLGDRGFKSIDLFKFINELGWKYCIRCTNDMLVKMEGKGKIKYLRDINLIKAYVKKFNGILLTAEKYKCNIAVCKAEDSDDTWYLATNMDNEYAVIEYKKRFIIEDKWTKNVVYFKNLYLCVSMAYTWMIILGADCSKNKKSKIIGATKKIHNKVIIYEEI